MICAEGAFDESSPKEVSQPLPPSSLKERERIVELCGLDVHPAAGRAKG